jgi:hypothetical protein
MPDCHLAHHHTGNPMQNERLKTARRQNVWRCRHSHKRHENDFGQRSESRVYSYSDFQ